MDQKKNQFSTFAGVFTPSILTILGVIMFLRAGYVVGEAGVINTIIILCLRLPEVGLIFLSHVLSGRSSAAL